MSKKIELAVGAAILAVCLSPSLLWAESGKATSKASPAIKSAPPAASELKATPTFTDVPAAEAAPTSEAPPVVEAPPPPDADDRLPLAILEVRFGGLFPSVFNKLDSTYTVHAGVAWQFALNRMLGVFAEFSYGEPKASGSRTDPRLTANGGEERWHLAVRDFGIAIGPRFGFHLGSRFDGYAGLGALVSFTRSVTTAAAGDVALGTNTEYSTRFGGLLRVGAGFKLGPGAIVLELAAAHVPVDHLITGDSNTSNLSAQIGYAFYLR